MITLPSVDTCSVLLLKQLYFLKQRFTLDWNVSDFSPVNKTGCHVPYSCLIVFPNCFMEFRHCHPIVPLNGLF